MGDGGLTAYDDSKLPRGDQFLPIGYAVWKMKICLHFPSNTSSKILKIHQGSPRKVLSMGSLGILRVSASTEVEEEK